MCQITTTSILRLSLIFVSLWLTACGGSSDSTPKPSPPDPAESSTWGEMEWGKGTWGK